jgi:ATP-dependent exoDNAse (exonuclease V) beta subunit
MGLRQTKLLEVDEKRQRSERGRTEYEAWDEARKTMLVAGSHPAVLLATATELAAAKPLPRLAEVDEIRVEEIKRNPGRPAGPRFGTLVHALMERVSLEADRSEIDRIAQFFSRMIGASQEEIAAAIEVIVAALASPLMLRARNAVEVRRESSIAVTLDDGMLVEGIADLAFAEKVGATVRWTVVDFKTDLEIAGRLDEYRVQLAIYSRAIQRATGLPASGVILWI